MSCGDKKMWMSCAAAAGMLIAAACGSGNGTGQAEGIVRAVREKYAPDKRTVLFDVTVAKRGGNLVLSGETTSAVAKSALFGALNSAGMNTVDSLRLLPGMDVGEEVYGIARLSVCNLRVKPAHSAEMATQVLLGTPLRILKDEGSWLQVQTPEQYIAWTQETGLVRMDSVRFAAWKAAPKLIFTADFGQAMAEAGAEMVVSDLVTGDILALEGDAGAFHKASFPDGRTALIKKEEARSLDEWIGGLDPNGDHVLDIARQMMGIPYLWGGTSFKGVDCSGFTKTAYFMNGIILPRDASQQVLTGREVDIYEGDTVNIESGLRDLQKGDLIFFTNDPSTRNDAEAKITHVGIYIENGEFIHSSGFVHRSSLLDTAANYSAHHAQTLTKARRILGAGPEEGITFVSEHPLY